MRSYRKKVVLNQGLMRQSAESEIGLGECHNLIPMAEGVKAYRYAEVRINAPLDCQGIVYLAGEYFAITKSQIYVLDTETQSWTAPAYSTLPFSSAESEDLRYLVLGTDIYLWVVSSSNKPIRYNVITKSSETTQLPNFKEACLFLDSYLILGNITISEGETFLDNTAGVYANLVYMLPLSSLSIDGNSLNLDDTDYESFVTTQPITALVGCMNHLFIGTEFGVWDYTFSTETEEFFQASCKRYGISCKLAASVENKIVFINSVGFAFLIDCLTDEQKPLGYTQFLNSSRRTFIDSKYGALHFYNTLSESNKNYAFSPTTETLFTTDCILFNNKEYTFLQASQVLSMTHEVGTNLTSFGSLGRVVVSQVSLIAKNMPNSTNGTYKFIGYYKDSKKQVTRISKLNKHLICSSKINADRISASVVFDYEDFDNILYELQLEVQYNDKRFKRSFYETDYGRQ